MYQTDQATAAETLPTPLTAAPQGFFTNGNPANGTPATILDADFLNMMMVELINVVEAGGLTPSKTTYDQVLNALKVLFAAAAGSSTQTFNVAPGATANEAVNLGQFGSSVAAAGYQKLPSGLIIQYGKFVTSASATVPVTFPIAFPTALASLTFGDNSLTVIGTVGSSASSNTGFNGDCFVSGARAAANSSYIAIGY